MALPTLFVSHGAPNIALHDSPVRSFIGSWSANLPRPGAIIMVSAHFETDGPCVVTDPAPEMIYDFRGFELELYEMTYPAPGDPGLAKRVLDLMAEAGLPAKAQQNRGYDHGAWVPLSLMYPDADIPVVQVSIDPARDARYHFALGQVLSPLRDNNILIIGSGQITHNLRAVFQKGKDAELDDNINDWVDAFVAWFHEKLDGGDLDAILDWDKRAPFVKENHPTDEHLMPIFTALGAATGTSGHFTAKRRHASKTMGFMSMDAYEFG